MNIVLLVFWLITGVLNLCSKEISKFSYFLVWSVVITYYISRIIL